MPAYQFYLDSFDIGDTRSHHEDTVVVDGLNVTITGEPELGAPCALRAV
jgi:hypothetical protein